MELQKKEDFDCEPQENWEEMSKQENSDNLFEKIEVTLNTFLNNLKKDDIPSYPNFTQTKKSQNLVQMQNNYNKPQYSLDYNTMKSNITIIILNLI